jgi:cysteinyl-tRNA synthetase
MAYESEGSVYFDVEKYNKTNQYGILSGRNIEEMYSNTRELDGQSDKRNSFDFAIWKNATPSHIMRWKSPWGDGFPGWHLECSAMGAKYLGETFDIHGGGMDLLFPHHESEIAQSVAANGKPPVKYWLHNNMITINGQKMGKSLGNFITLEEFINGSHKLLEQAYSPMTIRFFILQAHYRGTVDFSNQALQASGKAYERLMKAFARLDAIVPAEVSDFNVADLEKDCYDAMNDDFNTPMVIARLFDAVKFINAVADKQTTMSESQKLGLQKIQKNFVQEILGVKPEVQIDSSDSSLGNDLMKLIIELRLKMRQEKNFAMSDFIRDELKKAGIELKDTKEGTDWSKTN